MQQRTDKLDSFAVSVVIDPSATVISVGQVLILFTRLYFPSRSVTPTDSTTTVDTGSTKVSCQRRGANDQFWRIFLLVRRHWK